MELEKFFKDQFEAWLEKSGFANDIKNISQTLDLLMQIIVVQQKDVCKAIQIHPDTIRRKALASEIEILNRDGSTQNFITFKNVNKLNSRVRKQKRRSK